jgi:predicted DNA-binding ArsR family transcriptional regulator
MVASTLYAQTLSSLTATRAAMLDPTWIAAQQGQSPETRFQASQALIQVQQAISSLSTASLDDIAEKMMAQEQAIQTATSNLTASLEDLTKVQNVLNAVSSVISLVAKVVPLL